MGMAASQARLLSITARIHDVEHQAQSIQNAKLALATQSDQAYNDYVKALDATSLTLNALNTKTGEKSIIAATFNNLCSHTRATAADGSMYALRTRDGKLIVEDDIEKSYYNFITGIDGDRNGVVAGYDDAYFFAIMMTRGDNCQGFGYLDGESSNPIHEHIEAAENNAYTKLEETNPTLKELHDKLNELTHKYDIGGTVADGDIYDTNALFSSTEPTAAADKREYQETLRAYRNELYRVAGEEIYNSNELDPTSAKDFNEYSSPIFNYYVSLYNQIKAAGGCVSIRDYDGPNGDAANNSDWLQGMVQSGEITIEIVETDPKNGNVLFDTTSPSSDISVSYTTTSTIDTTALKKAEAEYEHKLQQINKKDKSFDLDLSKLETERNSLTTEYDSVKKVIEDNVKRTFGIFS